MSENYRQFVELYATQFKYKSYDAPGGKKYFINDTTEDFVLMTHAFQSKHVTFSSSSKTKSVRAGDLLMCVIECSGIFKEETL